MRLNQDHTSVMFLGTGNSLIASRYFFTRLYAIEGYLKASQLNDFLTKHKFFRVECDPISATDI